MGYDKVIDSAKLDACCTAEANAIRAKTGSSAQITYDWANSKGFADAIAAISGGGNGIQIVVPSTYDQLEYIANDGISYIDTGIVWTATKKIEISYCVDIDNNTDTGWAHIFGSAGCFIQFSNGSYGTSGKTANILINENSYQSSIMPLFPPVVLTVTNTTIKARAIYSLIDDEMTIHSQAGSSVTATTKGIAIFTRHKENDTVDYTIKNMWLYRWKVYDNDTLVQDLVPAMRKSDDVIGLYDVVSGNFFTNAAGSGSFSGGAL